MNASTANTNSSSNTTCSSRLPNAGGTQTPRAWDAAGESGQGDVGLRAGVHAQGRREATIFYRDA